MSNFSAISILPLPPYRCCSDLTDVKKGKLINPLFLSNNRLMSDHTDRRLEIERLGCEL